MAERGCKLLQYLTAWLLNTDTYYARFKKRKFDKTG